MWFRRHRAPDLVGIQQQTRQGPTRHARECPVVTGGPAAESLPCVGDRQSWHEYDVRAGDRLHAQQRPEWLQQPEAGWGEGGGPVIDRPVEVPARQTVCGGDESRQKHPFPGRDKGVEQQAGPWLLADRDVRRECRGPAYLRENEDPLGQEAALFGDLDEWSDRKSVV